MKIVLIYERRYFKNFEKYLEKKLKTQGQRIDFNETLTFYKIAKEKGKKILGKLYLQKLERKRRILI